MKIVVFSILMSAIALTESVAGDITLPYSNHAEFLEFIGHVKARINGERLYQADTEERIVLTSGQAMRLDFRDNPAGVAEFIFFYDAGLVHIVYRCTDDTETEYNSTCLHAERHKDSRGINASGAKTYLKTLTKWEQQEEQALIAFHTELPSAQEQQGFVKGQKRRELNRKYMEALRQQARAVRKWNPGQHIEPVKMIMDDPNGPSMSRLRERYNLEGQVCKAADDYERLRLILTWVQKQWKHNGNNTPSQPDPLTILKEAGEGKRFRCVEYAIVVAGCARALGMPARVLGLKRPDVETAQSGAGHVVAEVWLKQFNKWVFVDGQWGAIAEQNGTPLNAVEFQDSIAQRTSDLTVQFVSKGDQNNYIEWIIPYLYYLDFRMDQRHFPNESSPTDMVSGSDKIMLVPRGAKHPTVFQRNNPIKNCTYVSNPMYFYPTIGSAGQENPVMMSH